MMRREDDPVCFVLVVWSLRQYTDMVVPGNGSMYSDGGGAMVGEGVVLTGDCSGMRLECGERLQFRRL